MNKIQERLYGDRYMLINRWIGKSESYRDAAKIAAVIDPKTGEFFRHRMRYWSKSAAEQIKKYS